MRFCHAYDRVIIQSFSPEVVGHVRVLDPRFYRCQLFGRVGSEDVSPHQRLLRRYLLLNSISRPDAISGQLELLTGRVVQRYHRCGYAIFAWTGRSADDVKVCEERGIDILISEYIPPDC